MHLTFPERCSPLGCEGMDEQPPVVDVERERSRRERNRVAEQRLIETIEVRRVERDDLWLDLQLKAQDDPQQADLRRENASLKAENEQLRRAQASLTKENEQLRIKLERLELVFESQGH